VGVSRGTCPGVVFCFCGARQAIMTESRLEHRPRKVKDLIHEYQQGRLVIPEFQRDYVWKPGRAPQLLDSLYRGWPISSLLVWENEGGDVEPRRAEPRPRRGAARWLIDGQQRVITLARVFSCDEGIEVVFNAQSQEFARPNAATKQDNRWVPVTTPFKVRGDAHARPRSRAVETCGVLRNRVRLRTTFGPRTAFRSGIQSTCCAHRRSNWAS